MNWRAFIATLVACYVLILLAVAVGRIIWPPEPNPLLIDAKFPTFKPGERPRHRAPQYHRHQPCTVTPQPSSAPLDEGSLS